jgi:hypothetical protein
VADAPAYPVEYVDVNGIRVRVFCRHEYLTRRWIYKPGQKVLFVAPSQDGKTTFAFQLLKYTARPTLPAYVLVMKPRDATPAVWTNHLGYREVPTWPPPPQGLFSRDPKPSGYTIWPPHTFNVAIDNRTMQREFSKVLAHAYSQGNCIVFADEVYGLIAELPSPIDKDEPTIEDQVIALSTRGGGMGVGLWAATQKPSGTQGKGLPGFLISNTDKYFFSRDPDKRARDRYAEIGGVDPDLTYALVSQLRRHQFVGIDKGDGQGGPYVCIIDAR